MLDVVENAGVVDVDTEVVVTELAEVVVSMVEIAVMVVLESVTEVDVTVAAVLVAAVSVAVVLETLIVVTVMVELVRASPWGSWAWCMPRCCDTCVARLDLQRLWGMWARPRAHRLLPCSWAMAGGCQ